MASPETPPVIRFSPGDVTRGARGAVGAQDVADVLGLQNKGAFAANDPRFSQAAPGGGGAGIRGFLSRLGARANIAGAVALLAELVAEDLISQRERDIQGSLDALNRRRRRLGFERGNLREVLVRADAAGRAESDQVFAGPESIPDLQVPTPSAPGADVLQTTADIEPGSIQVEIPAQTPEFEFDPLEIPEPVIAPSPQPVGLPSPVPPSIPVPLPSTVTTPGFGIPVIPASFPRPAPVTFPVFTPVSFPRRLPVQDPLPLTPTQPGALPSEGPRSFAPGVLEFPQPQPQPNPQQRRCRPCPKKEKPKPRDKCFKGIYKEGLMDDDVDFTEMVEIDCVTGSEKNEPTGNPVPPQFL